MNEPHPLVILEHAAHHVFTAWKLSIDMRVSDTEAALQILKRAKNTISSECATQTKIVCELA